MTMFSINFKYNQTHYKALIRVIEATPYKDKEYRVTIMNGELEVLLYGNHVLVEKDGQIDLKASDLPHHIAELKTVIADALASFHAEEHAN
ncbi:MAG: hypothetical protein EOO01_27925 [Chitinophagaceae bacterium]|nr:MAG: hypothetical protein EOO01_27925 [Chitinophagaceae bacterium]